MLTARSQPDPCQDRPTANPHTHEAYSFGSFRAHTIPEKTDEGAGAFRELVARGQRPLGARAC
jgi:hypothetical protein